jgi:hypothetical protein
VAVFFFFFGSTEKGAAYYRLTELASYVGIDSICFTKLGQKKIDSKSLYNNTTF